MQILRSHFRSNEPDSRWNPAIYVSTALQVKPNAHSGLINTVLMFHIHRIKSGRYEEWFQIFGWGDIYYCWGRLERENVWGWSEIESSLRACLRWQQYNQWEWLSGKLDMWVWNSEERSEIFTLILRSLRTGLIHLTGFHKISQPCVWPRAGAW